MNPTTRKKGVHAKIEYVELLTVFDRSICPTSYAQYLEFMEESSDVLQRVKDSTSKSPFF